MEKNKNENHLKKIGTAIGTGLMAGLAGTLAMTISQMIEMKITGRKASRAPVSVVREVLDIKPVTKEKSEKVSNEVHWVYGTSLGLVRGTLGLFGLKGSFATTIHFVTIWGAELLMLPALKVAPPVTKEKPKDIIIDATHHAVYAIIAGCIFDAINKNKK